MGAHRTSIVESRSAAWFGVALLYLAILLAVVFWPVLQAGPASFVPSSPGALKPIEDADLTFETWLVARNAQTLASEPLRLFDTPHCAPAEKTMTFGLPMVAMGLLAIPVSLATPSAAAAFNGALILMLLISGIAMYLLVSEWTGSQIAGLVAAASYAFGPMRIANNITHPTEWDSCWLVLALYFAQRLFANGRWRDATGLAVACSMQIAASFYPFAAAAFFAPPFAVWLFLSYGLRQVRALQLLLVIGSIALTAAVVFGPFLELRSSGDSLLRTEFSFARGIDLLPGANLFLGWSTLLLAGFGLTRRRADGGIERDPRWALVAGALIVAAIATGPLHSVLASFVPGLDSVRVIFRLFVAVQVAACIVAGMGAAKLLDWTRRSWVPAVGAALVALTTASILLQSPRWTPLEVRIEASVAHFFDALEEMGNEGPLLELPIPWRGANPGIAPTEILASLHHGRRTSACFGSYPPKEWQEVREASGDLPSAAAVQQLREMGFTTVVVRHPPPNGSLFARRFEGKLKRARPKKMRLLLETEQKTAYSLDE